VQACDEYLSRLILKNKGLETTEILDMKTKKKNPLASALAAIPIVALAIFATSMIGSGAAAASDGTFAPLKQGDVNCDNAVNSVDALLVLRFGAGLGVNQNDPCPGIGTALTGAVHARIAGQVLQVKGTRDDDKLTLRLHAGDANVLEIDVGDDGTADFSFDRALVTKIKVNARDGNDLIRVDEVNGPIVEPASIHGGNGNDTILGGSAIETIDGGYGNDFIDGNRANDIAFMGAGDDTFRWDPGDASDVVEGEDGSDALLFNGSNGGESIDLSANGERFTFFREPGSITMDVNEVEISVFNALGGPDTMTVNDLAGTDVTQVNLLGNQLGGGDGLQDQVTVNGTAGNDVIVATGSAGTVDVTGLSATVAIVAAEAANDLLTVNALGGHDRVDASALQANAIKQLTVDGGSGDDLILGGRGADSLTGGDGDDFVDGNQANDNALLGSGNDTFRWDPGDGSDVVEGGDGSDTLLFNGAAVGGAANDTVELSANGERFIFFREPGSITMDVNDVETSVFNALGGHDAIEVNDLTGSDVKRVELNLENPLGSGDGDGQPDQVIVNGTEGNDAIVVTGNAGSINVAGLSAAVAIVAAEAANDLLTVNALGGDDRVDASALQADVIKQLTVDGGSGDDLILGGRGADSLIGGDGDDSVDGNQANDAAFLGAANDTFRWDPGDGSDVVEGGDGSDRLLFNGAGASEIVELSANGERFTFFREPGSITMDVNDVETSVFNALGGADTITVNDLTGTDVNQVDLNLQNPLGSGLGDGQPDQVIVNGTAGDDDIVVTGSAGNVDVKGLSAAVAIVHAEAANDRLDINTLAGNDTVDTSGLAAGVIQLFVDGVPM
jgi:Ca2+-binding RTX toxin-like protein